VLLRTRDCAVLVNKPLDQVERGPPHDGLVGDGGGGLGGLGGELAG